VALPLDQDFLEQIKSDVADLLNTAVVRGAVTAAVFLKEFTGGLPWPTSTSRDAWADDAKPWQPRGATGVAVRTLAELAFTSRRGRRRRSGAR